MRAAEMTAAAEGSAADRILDATLTVLASGGVAGTSMRAVAREAGVSLGLASYHFENKTALICAALERIGAKDLELVTPPPDIDGALGQLLHCLAQAFDPSFLDADYLSLRLQLWSLAGVEARYAAINQKAQRRYLAGLARLIGAAQPNTAPADVAQRAADVLVEQNGVWLTAILIPDQGAIDRALQRCEMIALGAEVT